jgi:hypothetical protein
LDWKTFTVISLFGAMLMFPLINWWQNLTVSTKNEDPIA